MARPPNLQKLRHDRLLCGRVFRFFVETWNWIVAVVDNFRGDGDINGQEGFLTVDRSDPDAPVVRLRLDRLGEKCLVAPPGAKLEFVSDVDWYVNGSVHVLRKRLRVLDLHTGKITDKEGTDFADGWDTAAETVGISTIIGS